MAGVEQLRRGLSFLDSEATEEEEKKEEEEVCPLNYIFLVNMEYKKHHGSFDVLRTQRLTTSFFWDKTPRNFQAFRSNIVPSSASVRRSLMKKTCSFETLINICHRN